LRLTDDGALHPDIQAAYWRHGYYIFEGVIDQAESAALRAAAARNTTARVKRAKRA
jgi:hypothetical protein